MGCRNGRSHQGYSLGPVWWRLRWHCFLIYCVSSKQEKQTIQEHLTALHCLFIQTTSHQFTSSLTPIRMTALRRKLYSTSNLTGEPRWEQQNISLNVLLFQLYFIYVQPGPADGCNTSPDNAAYRDMTDMAVRTSGNTFYFSDRTQIPNVRISHTI